MGTKISEIAKRYHAKKPTINARIKKLERENPDSVITERINNVIYVTETGVDLLAQDIRENPIIPKRVDGGGSSGKRIKPQVKQTAPDVADIYRERVNQLENELSARNDEIKRLTGIIEKQNETIGALNQTLTRALNESHVLIGREQSRTIPPELPPPSTPEQTPTSKHPKKRNLFSRLAVAGRVIRGDFD